MIKKKNKTKTTTKLIHQGLQSTVKVYVDLKSMTHGINITLV